ERGCQTDRKKRDHSDRERAYPLPTEDLAHSDENEDGSKRRQQLQPVRFQKLGDPGRARLYSTSLRGFCLDVFPALWFVGRPLETYILRRRSRGAWRRGLIDQR